MNMTLEAAKKKLHELIDTANEQQVLAILTLVEGVENNTYAYDDATLSILKERSEEYLSGKSKTYSIEESMARITAHRKNNGV
jgi:hypothetical protein